MTHAPAPWKYHLNVGPTKALIVEADGSTIVEVRNLVHDSRFEANVRVMTAGAGLLAACKHARQWCEANGHGIGNSTEPVWLESMCAAIAKAEGEGVP